MKGAKFQFTLALVLTMLLALVGSSLTLSAQAQDAPDDNSNPVVDGSGAPQGAQDGPVRMARVSFVKGDVNWRPDAQTDWSPVSLNLPIRQGAEIWANDNSTAEIQFDDGSRLRINNGTITLQTLYSDDQGEFTEITQSQGLGYLSLRTDHSIYQVNTPFASVKAVGPAKLRVGVADAVDIAVRQGAATVEGGPGKVTLNAGDYLGLRDANAAFDVRAIPHPDSWDSFNIDRDNQLDGIHVEHVPSDIGIVSDDLNAYGAWHDVPDYGWVWCPRVAGPDWRPYYDGHWVWVSPFGWTWVGNEPWGWAPYHYGTWVHVSYGWAWCPGPAVQYWSPAVVSFSFVEGRSVWCPLAPHEVRYPAALSIGFRGGDWSVFFSIGGAAAYYPGPRAGFFEPQPWRAAYVNHVTVVNVTTINNFNHNTFIQNGYVPVNARFNGATMAAANGFGGRGAFQPVRETSIYTHAQWVGAPPQGSRPVVGPPGVPVTAASFTPSHTFRNDIHLPPSVTNRPVFRAPVAARFDRYSAPINRQVIGPRTTPGGPGHNTNGPGNNPNHPSGPGSGRNYGNTSTNNPNPAASRAEEARRSLGLSGGNTSRTYGSTNRTTGQGYNGSSHSNGSNGQGNTGTSHTGSGSSTGRSSGTGSSAADAARHSLGYDSTHHSGSSDSTHRSGNGSSSSGKSDHSSGSSRSDHSSDSGRSDHSSGSGRSDHSDREKDKGSSDSKH